MRGAGGPARGLPPPAADFVQLALKLELVGGEAVANGVIALDFHARIIGPAVPLPHLSGDRLELHHWLLFLVAAVIHGSFSMSSPSAGGPLAFQVHSEQSRNAAPRLVGILAGGPPTRLWPSGGLLNEWKARRFVRTEIGRASCR